MMTDSLGPRLRRGPIPKATPTMHILLLKPINDVYFVIQPNLGLGYLASIARDYGHRVRIVDAGRERLTWKGFGELLRRERPDLVGIQAMSHEVPSVQRHLRIVRERLPEAITMVGGPHVGGDPEVAMELFPDADFGFAGEAEVGFERFLQLEAGESRDPARLAEVPSLAWRREGAIVVNPRQSARDLDALRLPAWDLMPPADYPTAPHGNFCRRAPVAPLLTSRGCPFPCTFCAGKTVTGTVVRYRSIDGVIDEVRMLHDRFGVREIHIEDENFTLKKGRVEEFCERLLSLGLGLALALPNGVRLDTLDAQILRLMERAGFYSVGVGVESGSDRILGLMRKGMTREQIRGKIDLIKTHTRMHLTGFFILGYPSETEQEIRETIEFAKALKIDKANFMYLSPLPGSELWDTYVKRNGVQVDWSTFFSYRVVRGLSDVAPERLVRLHQRAMWEFYARPRIFLKLLTQIRSFEQVRMLGRRFKNIFLTPKSDKTSATGN